MAFRVEITPQAFDDLDSIAAYIQEHGSFDIAEKWFNGIINEIFLLKEMPSRCPIAPETQEIGLEIRHLLFGRKNRAYKIYFLIHQDTPASAEVQVPSLKRSQCPYSWMSTDVITSHP